MAEVHAVEVSDRKDRRLRLLIKFSDTRNDNHKAKIPSRRCDLQVSLLDCGTVPKALEEIRKFILYHTLVIWRTKAFWLRALVCWTVGAVLLLNDDMMNFDARLQVRGARPSEANIVLIDISEREWADLEPESRNILRPLKEVVSISDAFFWNPNAWEKLLKGVTAQEPRAVGVMFFFGENVRWPSSSPSFRRVFEDPRIVWGADIDPAGRVLLPTFASTYNGNVGLRGVRSDDDGLVRRFSSALLQVPHIGVRLAEVAKGLGPGGLGPNYQQSTVINYAGPGASFKVIPFRDVLDGRVDSEVFRDQIVLIGSLTNPIEQFQTPLGRMSRTEITANIVDNVLLERTVDRFPNVVYLALLAMLMAASLWVLVAYPQSVALVFFVMTAVVWSAASAWMFDVAYIWSPVMAALAQLATTYIVFLSYRLALNEQRTWRLQQEQIYLSEIEQLKTNFVSMMSHDLKTPIAKIQAICDRLLASQPESPINADLKSLRRSSDDLHRYIQSILQVTKVEAKDFKISKAVTDINEDIEKVVQRLQPLAQEKQISIVTNLEPMFSIEVDTTLIQEVIHNLIENAIKYTPPSGRVTVASRETDDNVEVVIEDTGPGIPPEEQSEVWGKFTRGRTEASAGISSGTGLGLYLVKYFIELHGGRVFLNSELGKGTKIGFAIPISEGVP